MQKIIVPRLVDSTLLAIQVFANFLALNLAFDIRLGLFKQRR